LTILSFLKIVVYILRDSANIVEVVLLQVVYFDQAGMFCGVLDSRYKKDVASEKW
jgi:hypothetical protein